METTEVYNTIIRNGIEYIETKKILNNGITYLIYSNVENPKDFFINKLIIKDNKEFVVNLDNKEEFEKVINLIVKETLN